MASIPLKIGEAAKAVGIKPRTIRYYERCGLLKAGRMVSRYRVFEEQDFARLKLIKQLRKFGFSISETKQVLPVLLDRLPRSQRTKTLKAFLERRLSMAEERLRELSVIHEELQERLKRMSSRRKATKDSCCEPFCGPEVCSPGLVRITGLTQQTQQGGGG